MKYIKHVRYDDIKSLYKYVIAWGCGPLFFLNYAEDCFRIDFIIDGTKEKAGSRYNKIDIYDETHLEGIRERTLVVIYTIYEADVLQQLAKYDKGNFDTIIYPLLDVYLGDHIIKAHINGKSAEDYLLLTLLRQLGIKDKVSFLEIGVCHPVFRNNTFLLYEQWKAKREGYCGVLVEANPSCYELIHEYRPDDRLLRCGVGREAGESVFYEFPNYMGHSTFVKEKAEEIKKLGFRCVQHVVPIEDVNSLLENHFEVAPDILAIDAEGLDYDIIESLDEERYPVKIILTERQTDTQYKMASLLEKKRYKVFAKTMENDIWIKDSSTLYY